MVTSMLWSNFSFFSSFEIVLDRFWIGLSRQRKRWYFTRMAIDTRLFYSRVNLWDPGKRFLKNLSSSYLHLVWVKASDFSRSAHAIQQIFDLLVHLFERWARLIAMDNPICFSNDLLYLIADEENASSTAFISQRLLDFSRRSIISFSSDSWNSG